MHKYRESPLKRLNWDHERGAFDWYRQKGTKRGKSLVEFTFVLISPMQFVLHILSSKGELDSVFVCISLIHALLFP
jgi:hypothetical protein